jgi:hypothetical protein
LDPHEDGPPWLRLKVRERPLGGRTRRPFCIALTDLVVVVIEAPGEAETFLEGVSGDERGGGVARIPQTFSEQHSVVVEEPRVLADAVLGRVEAGQHRGVCRKRHRHRRPGLRKAHPPGGQAIQRRRLDGFVLEAHAVSPGGVQRDQEDRWPRCGGFSRRLRRLR